VKRYACNSYYELAKRGKKGGSEGGRAHNFFLFLLRKTKRRRRKRKNSLLFRRKKKKEEGENTHPCFLLIRPERKRKKERGGKIDRPPGNPTVPLAGRKRGKKGGGVVYHLLSGRGPGGRKKKVRIRGKRKTDLSTIILFGRERGGRRCSTLLRGHLSKKKREGENTTTWWPILTLPLRGERGGKGRGCL